MCLEQTLLEVDKERLCLFSIMIFMILTIPEVILLKNISVLNVIMKMGLGCMKK